MIYLLLSILASTIIFIVFKLIKKYSLDTLQVIVVNYITAGSIGFILNSNELPIGSIPKQQWFFGAILLGFLFITIFNIMALTAQKNGISVASVATKMSVAIPILFGIYMYNESYGLIKLGGIILALIAVYLSSIKSENIIGSIKNLWLPIILFIGSGIIDTSIKYLQFLYLEESGFSIFSAVIFLCAACIGTIILGIKYIRNRDSLSLKSIPAGIILGIVNFGSIYFLLKALNFQDFESSTVFAINNVAIVLLSTLMGLLIFKEKLYTKNWIGIVLAIISIFLISISR